MVQQTVDHYSCLEASKQVLTLYHLDGVQIRGKARVDMKDFLSIPDHAQQVTGEDNLRQEQREKGSQVEDSHTGNTSPTQPFLSTRTLLSPVGKMTLSTSRSSRILSNSRSSSF